MKSLLLYINMVVMAKMQNLYYGKKYNFNKTGDGSLSYYTIET